MIKKHKLYCLSGLDDVDPEISRKMLATLNSLGSAEEMVKLVAEHAGRRVISVRVAQRIFSVRKELGKFDDLQQIAVVPGIGPKKITILLHALNHSDSSGYL
jgi:hypothetical protein